MSDTAIILQTLLTNKKSFILPQITCADGSTMSVQASEAHYCTPRDNVGPYTNVEVWLCGVVPEWSEYGDGEDPYAQLPIELVAEEIDRRGGFKWQSK